MSKRKRAETGVDGSDHPDKSRDRFKQRLQDASLEYFTEVSKRWDDIQDEEERTLLSTSALQEAAQDPQKSCNDATCSRILERMCLGADWEGQAALAGAIAQSDVWLEVACNPFGSHVVETLLKAIIRREQQQQQNVSEALEPMTAQTLEHMYALATDRFGSHVLRKLVCALAGWDVLPGQANSKAGKAQPGKAVACEPGQLQRQEPAHPQLLAQVAEVLGSEEAAQQLAGELPFSALAGPCLQAVLLALAADSNMADKLIKGILGATQGMKEQAEEDDLLAGTSTEKLQRLMQDRHASHLMQTVVRVASPGLRAAIVSLGVRGALSALSKHPTANYVVQALLSSASSPAEAQQAVQELQAHIPHLLANQRAGVVAALVLACAQAQVGQVAVYRQLSAGLRAAAAGTDPQKLNLAEALVVLDAPLALQAAKGAQPGKACQPPSALGCAMLAALLHHYPKEASQDFANALEALSTAQLALLGASGGGSRVVQAFLEGSGTSKAKRRMIKKLTGSFGALALTPGGSFLTESCFGAASLKQKEAIVAELAAANKAIESSSNRGAKLLIRCGVQGFISNPEAWRNRQGSAADVRKDFDSLLTRDVTK